MKTITIYEFNELPRHAQSAYVELNRLDIANKEGIIEQYRCSFIALIKSELTILAFNHIEFYFEFERLRLPNRIGGLSFSAIGSDVVKKILREKCGSDLITNVLMNYIIIDYYGPGELYVYPSASENDISIGLYDIFDNRKLSNIRELLKQVLSKARTQYITMTNKYKKIGADMYSEAISDEVLIDEMGTIEGYYTIDGIKVE